jgi:pSer/pThr/pTyr-binding forkhead associated (FHA) protein
VTEVLFRGSFMQVQLILVSGTRRWKTQLRGNEATVGRSLGCTVRIPSARVSRLHCRLQQEGNVLTVEDLESVNGTFVNGKQIHAPTVVRSGDRVTVGPITFAIEIEYDLSTVDVPTKDYEDVVVLEDVNNPAEDDTDLILDDAPPWAIPIAPPQDPPPTKRKRKP